MAILSTINLKGRALPGVYSRIAEVRVLARQNLEVILIISDYASPEAAQKDEFGRRAEEPLRERIIELPLELALALVAQVVPGQPPDKTADNITSQAYRAAMATGAFVDAEAV